MNPLDNIKDLAYRVERFMMGQRPPEWLIEGGQAKIILFLNHVLKQEQLARERLRRQAGKTVELRWNRFNFLIAFTPAGLLERLQPVDAQADLVVCINEGSALTLLTQLSKGERPSIRIEGDVQLAAEVNWQLDHVRWDLEADLASICGDEVARMLTQMGTDISQAVRTFVAKVQDKVSTFKA